MSMLTKQIERRLEDYAGILVTVEEDEDRIVLSGMVENEDLKEAAQDIVAEVAPGRDIVNELDVMEVIPEEIGALNLAETRTGMMEGASPDLADDESLEPGDFTDQETVDSPQMAGGPSMSLEEDEVSEGGGVWVPPTDPVGTNREIIGGFSGSSLDSVEVDRSSDGTLGDEGIADAVRRELREDSATTDLQVEIEVAEGVVYIRGAVALLEDAENAEAVAATVPGVVDVIDETEVEGLG
jgi:osmotically-inducible protein OsmY